MAWLHNAVAWSRRVSCHPRVQQAPFTVLSWVGLGDTGLLLFTYLLLTVLCVPLPLQREILLFLSFCENQSFQGWMGAGAEPVQLCFTLEEPCGLRDRVSLGANVQILGFPSALETAHHNEQEVSWQSGNPLLAGWD